MHATTDLCTSNLGTVRTLIQELIASPQVTLKLAVLQ